MAEPELSAKDRLQIERLNKKGLFSLADAKVFIGILVMGLAVLGYVGFRVYMAQLEAQAEQEREESLQLMQQTYPY